MSEQRIDWGELARRDGTKLFRAARVFVSDDDTAWDCVQEALLVAVSAPPATVPAQPLEWLCGVAANKARHAFRGRSRFRAFLDRLAFHRAGTPPRSPSPDADPAALNRALGRLSERLRDAVILRYYAGMTMAEIARAQGGSESAAKMRVHRGLGRLRRILGAAPLAVLLLAKFADASGTSLAAAVATGSAAGAAGAAGLVTATAAKANFALLAGALILLAVGTAVFVVNGDEAPDPGPLPAEPAAEVLAASSTESEDEEPVVAGAQGDRGRVLGVVLSPDGGSVRDTLISFARAGSPPRTCPDLGTSTARTDAKGRFTLTGVPAGVELMVVASRLPYRKTASAPFTVPEGGEVDGIIVRLLPGAAVYGLVVTDGGEPVPGAAIRVTTGNTTRWVGANQPALLPGETKTDANGKYRLSGLELRGYRVFAEKNGYLPVHALGAVATFAGGEAPVLVLRKGLVFEGVMVDGAGNPVTDGVVSLAGEHESGGQARTDEQGRFSINTVLPGTHRLYAGAKGYEAWKPRDIELPTNEPYRVRLSKGVSIAGTVLDAAGEPVSRAIINGWDSQGGRHAAMADEAGRFVVDGLPSDGTVTLAVHSADPLYADLTVRCDSAEGVVFRPTERVSVAGRVVHPDGSPAARASVEICLVGHRPRGSRDRPIRLTDMADEAGCFRFDGLMGEKFTVRARRSGYMPTEWEEVSGGESGVVLRLREGLSISGTVVFSGRPEKDWGVSAFGPDGTGQAGLRDREGGFRILGLSEGDYTLVLSTETWRQRTEGVKAGAEDVILRMPDLAELPLQDLRLPLPEGVHPQGWLSIWEAIDALGVRDEAALIRAIPDLMPTVSGNRWLAEIPFLLLRRIGTPEAIGMMTRLLRSPELLPSDSLPRVEAHLMAVEHPGLGPAAIWRYRDVVEKHEESWVTIDPLTKILARHGGAEGAKIVAGLLGNGTRSAVQALEFARSPILLEAGLAWMNTGPNLNSAAIAGVGLVRAFGTAAEEALLTRALDTEAPSSARSAAVVAAAAGGGERTTDRLLRINPVEEPSVAVLVVTRLVARKDRPLEGARADLVREHARVLLVHPDDSIRAALLSQVRYREVFRTAEFLLLLEERAKVEKYPPALTFLREAVERIREDLEER